MKKTLLLAVVSVFLMNCGGKDKTSENGEQSTLLEEPTTEQVTPETTTSETEVADSNDAMSNKGIGPVKNVEIGETIDAALAKKGEEIYGAKCTACHKPTEKFIGPAPKGILERRSPEWVMNMILNPEEMIQKDPIAKQLLAEANGAPMANQGLTQDEARAVLEYFRTIK